MVDRVEQQRRGQTPRQTSTKHPYAAIEHRVIDSPAFAALRPSSALLLLLIARQLTKSNNGHLQATFEWCKRFGIGSEHTLRDALAELIAHGFIYRTKSHGANRVWANYAVTWLPITDKSGLFLDGWKQQAWRDWTPSEKKAPGKKCRTLPAESAVSTPTFRQKVQEVRGQKVQGMNLMPCSSAVQASIQPIRTQQTHAGGEWIADYITRLAARGLAHACPVQALH